MAMNSGSSSDDEMITEINVTPFVDVVLVLLILFMLAAPVVYQSAVKIELPSAVTGESVNHVTLKLYVTGDGTMQMDQKQFTLDLLPGIVAKALKADPRADAVVFADRKTQHGSVIELIDALKKAGLHQVALGVDKQSDKESAK